MDVITQGNSVYCQKHKGFFFSYSYARTGKPPIECPVCKSYNYWEKKRSEVKNGTGNKAISQDKQQD